MGLFHTDGGVFHFNETAGIRPSISDISTHAGTTGSYVGRSARQDPSLSFKPPSSQWGASLPLTEASDGLCTCINEIRL